MADPTYLLSEEQVFTINVLKAINDDLRYTQYLNLNTMIFRRTDLLKSCSSEKIDLIKDKILSDCLEILASNSRNFKGMVSGKGGYAHLVVVYKYMERLLNYYLNIMETKANKFDELVYSINVGKNNPTFIIENDLEFTFDDVQKTVHLLNEAVRNYYEIYFKKILKTIFSNDEVINFKIQEKELSHILGIQLKKIVNNSIYKELFKITDYEQEAINDYTKDITGTTAISVLCKIIDLSEDKLLELEYDRLRKMEKEYKYKIDRNQKLDRTFIEYSKINVKSKAFLSFKPLEELSLVLKLPTGEELIDGRKRKVEKGEAEPSDYSLLLSKNGLSEVYKYTTLVSNYQPSQDRRYFESLLLKTNDEISNLGSISSSAVSLKVVLETDDGVGCASREFTTLEQLKFIREVSEDFKSLNMEELFEYVKTLINDNGRTRR